MAEAPNSTIKRVDKTIRALSVPRESHLNRSALSVPRESHLGHSVVSATMTADVKLSDDSDSDDSSDGWETDLENDEPKNEYDSTGRTLYLRTCEKLGIVPVSYFVRHMTEPEMTMMHHGLGPAGIHAISLALLYNTTITNLNLRDNGIGEEGGQILAKLLRENYYITELDISENQLGSKSVSEFAETLRESTNLVHLALSGNDLCDKDAEVLCSGLLSNTTLTSLDLSNNRFSSTACESFCKLLDENFTLVYLDLSWNHILANGAQLLAKGLTGNMKLKSLNLAWNGIANGGAQAISRALLENIVLAVIDLSSNRIDSSGTNALAQVLETNSSIEEMRLAKNFIRNNGACALVKAVLKNQDSRLQKLDITGVNTENDFRLLAEEVKKIRPELILVTNTTPERRQKPETPDPGALIRSYIAKQHVRVVDLFRSLDKDQSMQVSVKEFAEGLRRSDVGLTNFEVQRIIDVLDEDEDGEIDYSEFISIQGMWSQRAQEAQRRKSRYKI